VPKNLRSTLAKPKYGLLDKGVLGLGKNKSILGIIGIIVLAIGVGSFFFFEEPAGREPIKIGVILAETGSSTVLDTEVRDGMLMAVDEINSFDGINGRPIELIFVDNESNPEKAKKDFLEIEEDHAPLLYISSTSAISTAVSPLAEEHEVVLLAVAATATNITVDKEWTYRYYPTAEAEAVSLIQILDDLNVKNLGMLYQKDEFGRSVADAVEVGYQNSERTVNREPFDLNATDFKDHIMNLQNTDAIVLVAWPNYVEVIFKNMREVNYPGHIIGSSDAVIPNLINMPEANGVYLATPTIYNSEYST
jgi:branched-chain amino acid transport system substrate-binding protein